MLQGTNQFSECYQLFIDRIASQVEQYSQNPKTLPVHIQRLISLHTLNAIYNDILENRETYYRELCNERVYEASNIKALRLPDMKRVSEDGSVFKLGHSVRVKKKDKASRTFYILHDHITNEIILIVQTKSRLSNNKQDKLTSIAKGGSKEPDVAWRLDCPKPMAWISLSIHYTRANTKVVLPSAEFIKKREERTYSAYIEAILTELIYLKAREQCGEEVPFLYPLMTPLHESKREKKITLFFRKIDFSLYDIFCGTIPNPPIDQIRNMVFDLLRGLEFLHRNNLIHQDLSVRNLLFSVSDRHRLFIIDFGLTDSSWFPRIWSAPRYLASPELEATYSIFNLLQNNKYFSSFGKYLNKQDVDCKIKYTPNSANDIWAIGMVLAAWMQPYFINIIAESALISNYAQFEASIRVNPFYAGLLAHNRENRFTAEQAISCLTQNPELLELKVVDCTREPAFIALREMEQEAKIFFKRIENSLLLTNEKIDLRSLFTFVGNHRRNIRFLMTTPSMLEGTELGYFCDLPASKTNLDANLRICFVPGQGFILLKEYYKVAVRVLRIDCFPPVDYATQEIYTTNLPLVVQKIKKVEQFNENLSAPLFLEEIIGGVIEAMDGTFSVKLISPLPTGSLRTLYNSSHRFQPNEIQLFILTMLCALNIMHDNNYVHQALQFSKVCYFKEDGSITRFVLSGVGHSDPFYGMVEPCDFTSPELFDPKTYKVPSYAKDILRLREDGTVTFELTKDLHPHPANDMWALGVMFLKLLVGKEINDYSQYQSLIDSHSLLSGLLQPDRNKRLTAKNILEIFKQCDMKLFTCLEEHSVGFTPQYDAQKKRANIASTVDELADDLDNVDLNAGTSNKIN